MKTGISLRLGPVGLLVFLVGGLASLGCKADQVTGHGMDVMLLDDVPQGCEDLGVVVGHGGGLLGAYSKPRINRESAENDARNQAAARGATHLLLHPEDVTQGEGRQPTEQDTAPELAHGYGTGSNVTVAGTAFKCPPDMAPGKNAMTIRAGSALVEAQAPTSISMAPLGQLKSITVFQRVPLPSGTGITENEVLKVEDSKEIQRVVDSLQPGCDRRGIDRWLESRRGLTHFLMTPSAVRNADRSGDVVSRPRVWSQNPSQRKTPRVMPERNARRSSCRVNPVARGAWT